MMRRPWQIWLVFGLCLAVVLPAMAWLTHKTIEADRAEWIARLSAAREEAVGSVLWQMDTELTTLLAQEAARPSFVYTSFYAAPAVLVPADDRTESSKSPTPQASSKKLPPAETLVAEQFPSPLLTQPSEYVLLHFQISATGNISSPQVPGDKAALALQNGASADNIRLSNERLVALHQDIEFKRLLELLPSQHLSEIAIGQWQINNNEVAGVAQQTGQAVGNTLDFPPVQQEIEAQYAQQSAIPTAQQQDQPYLANSSRGQSRVGNDLEQRNRAYQSAAQRQIVEQRLNFYSARPQLKYVSEGVSQPLWLDDRLILTRRVKRGDDEVVQGCWLDWDKLRTDLVTRYAADLPGLELQPVRRDTDRNQIKVSRLLATLPVQVSLPEDAFPLQPWSPLCFALVVAWSMLGLATFAVALLLQGVITLSERRGAFVSAVTHELRTPLTTFRMYAEMLAENMVPSAETRQQYLETLRVEADRLSHLVENVLAYARLERGRQGQRREATSLSNIFDSASHRFADRAAQAGMQLVLEPSLETDLVVRTDPAAVEQILFNLIDNACKYAVQASDKRLHLSLATAGNFAVLRVADHGPGINSKAARRLFQPFSKSVHDAACSAPGVGLGLALSRRLAHELGGRLVLESSATAGATFALYLPLLR